MSIKKALVVDDSKVCRLSIARLLQEKHIEVDEAESGESALERLKVARPDVIFMDVFMSGMNGYVAARAIAENPRLHGIPVVMCTSRNSENDRALATSAGASGFMVKPATEGGLESVLTALGAGAGGEKSSSSRSGSTRGRSNGSNGAHSQAGGRAQADELQRAVRAAIEEAQRAAVESVKDAADEARKEATRALKAAVDEASQDVGARLAREAGEALDRGRADAVASIEARAAEALANDGPLMRALEARLVKLTEETVARTLERTVAAALDAALARAVPKALEASAPSAAEAALSRLAPSAVDRRLNESMKKSLDGALKTLQEAAGARVEAELETRCGPRVEAALAEHLSSDAVDARVRETVQTSALTVEPRLVQAAEESARRTATWIADAATAKLSATMTRRALPQWIGLAVALVLGGVALLR